MNKLLEMENSRILWNRNKKGQITELVVAEFLTPTQNKHLYEEFTSDIGNCRSDWSQWRVEDIVYYIFVGHDFETHSARINAFQEISKIKEVSERFPVVKSII